MDQASISKITGLRRQIFGLEARLKKLESQCDHKLPGGSYATDSRATYQFCKICGANISHVVQQAAR